MERKIDMAVQSNEMRKAFSMAHDYLEKYYKKFKHISLKKVQSKSRHTDVILVRSIMAVILKEQKYSFHKIGQMMGNRTHATVINLLKYDTKYAGRNGRIEAYRNIVKKTKSDCYIVCLYQKIKYHKAEIDILENNLNKAIRESCSTSNNIDQS